MNVIKLESDKFDEIKLLFKNIFMNEPWNDDWSNDNQLAEYMLDLTGNRNSLAIGLYDENELIVASGFRRTGAHEFYEHMGYKKRHFGSARILSVVRENSSFYNNTTIR